MTVTKSYVARNYGVRDRIIDNLGVAAAVLMVVFVLLFFSGAMDFGRDISVQIDQASMQGSARIHRQVASGMGKLRIGVTMQRHISCAGSIPIAYPR